MRKIIFIIAILLILLSGILYFVTTREKLTFQDEPSVADLSTSLTKEYKNSKYDFSLKIPTDIKLREINLEDSDFIILENEKSEGIQIQISPFENIRELSIEMIQRDLPDLKILDSRPIGIADNTGIFFKSDNPVFGGSSAEIWFVFRGNLYQVSTYEKFSDLLKAIFNTWKFTK